MRCALVGSFTLLTTTAQAIAQTNAQTTAQTAPKTAVMTSLNDLHHRARPLLLFAPTPDDPTLQAQLRILNQNPADLNDRQILPIVLTLHPQSYAAPQGAVPNTSPAPGLPATHLSPTEADALRHLFHPSPSGFTAILIGKDGGAKMRSTHPFTIEQLNKTVDAMPMRQDEMRRHPR